MTKKLTPPLSAKAKRNSSKARLKKPASVALVVTRSPLRHFRLVSHAHSGKVIHHQHTSHVALLLMLLFVGVMLALSHQMSTAMSGTVTVGAVVNGPPPAVGAQITSPADGTTVVDETIVGVSGTCEPSTFVVVKSNNLLVGSTNCTVAGLFSLSVDLELGENVLTALNFDNVNQPGPTTSPVRITLTRSQPVEPSSPEIAPIPSLTLPDNPSLIPGLPDLGWWCDTGESTAPSADTVNRIARACEPPKDCDSYDPGEGAASAGGPLSVSVVCIPRILEKNQFYKLGLVVRGGLPPYALNIDFGSNDRDVLVSVPQPGYSTVSFRYTNVGAFNVNINLTDSEGEVSVVETAVQVGGDGQTLIASIAEAVSPENWFDSPVPLYVVAVVVTLAFWAGDIFDRRFGARKPGGHAGGRKRAA